MSRLAESRLLLFELLSETVKSDRQEMLVVNGLNAIRPGSAEKTGPGAHYDFVLKEKVSTFEPGNYEVKNFTGSPNNDGEFARLGDQTTKVITSNGYVIALRELASFVKANDSDLERELESMPEMVRQLGTWKAGGRDKELTLCNNIIGLEVGAYLYSKVFATTDFIDSLRKTAEIISGQFIDVEPSTTVDLYASPKGEKPINIGKVTQDDLIMKVIPSLQDRKGTTESPSRLVAKYVELLKKTVDAYGTWDEMRLIGQSIAHVEGIFGVKELGNTTQVLFAKSDDLTIKRMTQNGRLVLKFRSFDPAKNDISSVVLGTTGTSPMEEGDRADEVSMGGAAGVTTPLGTDASGGKGGPGVRKGKGKSVLDKNARSQGKFFGGAKPVTEASTIPISISVGIYGAQSDSAAGDFDGDGDTDVRNDTKRDKGSIYRGGNGDLQRNARQIGRHFAGAEVIDDTYEMLQDLLSGKELTPAQAKRFKRSSIVGESTRRTPGLVAAINDIHPRLLDETHVRLVLGCDPLPLNEGAIGEAHLRLLLREQLLYEGWWDSAKQLLGQGIDKVKEKAEDAKEAVETFGKNTKGVVAALWLSTTDGKLLEALVAATRHRLSKGFKTFLKPLYKVANFFKDVSDIPKKVVDKIALGLDKFMEGLRSPGWKGLLTSMAAYLGYRWLVDTFAERVSKIVDDYTGEVKDATLDKAKSLGNALTGGLIDEMQEKLGSIVKELAGSAIEQLAGPLAWVKKLVKIFEKVDWVTSNLIGIVSMGQFAAGVGKAS